MVRKQISVTKTGYRKGGEAGSFVEVVEARRSPESATGLRETWLWPKAFASDVEDGCPEHVLRVKRARLLDVCGC